VALDPKFAEAVVAVDRLGRPARRRYRHGLVWPGGAARFSLRILSVAEVQVARAAAVKRFAKALDWKPDAMNSDEFTEETILQILSRAIEVDGGGEQLFGSADEMRGEVERGELDLLWIEYVDLREATDPDDGTLDEELVDGITAILKKKDESRLRALAASTLRAYLRTMAPLLATSQTGRSSSISSSSAPSATSSESGDE
jgi:hypothetical protein